MKYHQGAGEVQYIVKEQKNDKDILVALVSINIALTLLNVIINAVS